jgi:carbon storage regulator
MLVLSRKTGEKIMIGTNIALTVVEVSGHRVKLGIDAPEHITILRGEIAPMITPTGSPREKYPQELG